MITFWASDCCERLGSYVETIFLINPIFAQIDYFTPTPTV